MKKQVIAFLFFIAGTILFDQLFWEQKWGINVLLFCIFSITGLILLNTDRFKNNEVLLVGLGTLFSAIMVVVNNSVLSKVIFTTSFITLIGIYNKPLLRQLFSAFIEGLLQIAISPSKISAKLSLLHNGNNKGAMILRNAKLSILPIIVFAFFYMMYYNANPKLAEWSNRFWKNFEWLFQFDISVQKIMFVLLGLVISGAIFFEKFKSIRHENNYEENLRRTRDQNSLKSRAFTMVALKNEYRMAVILIVMLNILLLLVNVIDIRYVWFGFDHLNPENLKNYVHEGTWLLITAIISAMVVLLFFFRKNINFLPGNNFLKKASYLWILQNAVLAASVAIRNYRYIDYHGLAYKRIGVMIFLLLVFIGLLYMQLKIQNRKTLNYLINKNSWAVYMVLILSTAMNWDAFITKYNLNTNTRLASNTYILLNTLSSKNLYLLYKEEHLLFTKPSYPVISEELIMELREKKKESFLSQQIKYQWPSWNLPDHINRNYFIKNEAKFEDGN